MSFKIESLVNIDLRRTAMNGCFVWLSRGKGILCYMLTLLITYHMTNYTYNSSNMYIRLYKCGYLLNGKNMMLMLM